MGFCLEQKKKYEIRKTKIKKIIKVNKINQSKLSKDGKWSGQTFHENIWHLGTIHIWRP